ncbi:MAG: PKD domain-containing protein [Cyclobacteriaceae bacterium]|nr:PKD domain-containing protein [Cyclobacteriaceae bacterium]
MKGKRLLSLFKVLAIGMLPVFFLACSKKETPVPAPVASFDYTIDGKTVTITNKSTNAVDYSWDFGDGGTSTDESPSHTYDANGGYIIKLTATNESGSDDSEVAVEIINIVIDGSFADWDDVPAAATYTEGEGGTILEVKFENLAKNKLFVYVKTTDASTDFIDLFINADENASTGFDSWQYPLTKGWDILYEGYVATQTTPADPFFGNYDDAAAADAGSQTAWVWHQLTPASTFVVMANAGAVSGGMAYEFSFDMSEIPASYTIGSTLDIFINDVDAPDGVGSDWANIGNFPAPIGEETSAAFTYTLK